MFQKLYDDALEYNGGIEKRFTVYMTSFAQYIENSSQKLCQEWVRNSVDPDELLKENGISSENLANVIKDFIVNI